MAKARLKVFQTHIGFYDLIVAAPSMKAAAETWGVKPHIFAQGFAQAAQDPQAVAAALREPGQVLKRIHGKSGAFTAQPGLPEAPKLSLKQKRASAKAKKNPPRTGGGTKTRPGKSRAPGPPKGAG